ncbi:NADH:flavin oxidoreductase/NADH oxidase [Coprinopsis marcescibilis]|uniref:NADH:flavin oxidoreductase/NADH oxidase n=1 Tax=Coprinopsis marcescibilis TaxID=230819 RepID=A0A5C3KVE8_COPMA|nr:NADH:flavin oxidoreductase/NADH oxidase [Coprinopsis marcescibilis]
MSPTEAPKLFKPIDLGKVHLRHRVVLAPLTRFRVHPETRTPVLPLVKTYYSQRASIPGTLIITEATTVSREAGDDEFFPGMWSDEHVKAWKEIVDVIHEKGSFVFAQLWAPGRMAKPQALAKYGYRYVAPSPIPLAHRPLEDPAPQEMTREDINNYVQMFANAAKRAVYEAGFDGVEIHCANGYLFDQFLRDVSNQRTDEYGGSIERRCKFPLEVVNALVEAVGEDRMAVRLSPWNTNGDMGMEAPVPQFARFITQLASSYPKLAYLHMIEPTHDPNDHFAFRVPLEGESNDPFRKIWAPRPFISCGCYSRSRAIRTAEEKGDLIAFGQTFISNPDLPFRLKHDIPLQHGDAETFYSHESKGYIDYPFSDEFLALKPGSTNSDVLIPCPGGTHSVPPSFRRKAYL